MILTIFFYILFIAKHKKYIKYVNTNMDLEQNYSEEKKSKKSVIKKIVFFTIKYICLIFSIYLDLCFFYYNFFNE